MSTLESRECKGRLMMLPNTNLLLADLLCLLTRVSTKGSIQKALSYSVIENSEQNLETLVFQYIP